MLYLLGLHWFLRSWLLHLLGLQGWCVVAIDGGSSYSVGRISSTCRSSTQISSQLFGQCLLKWSLSLVDCSTRCEGRLGRSRSWNKTWDLRWRVLDRWSSWHVDHRKRAVHLSVSGIHSVVLNSNGRSRSRSHHVAAIISSIQPVL